ncbi:MAG: exodeoxyribonuclease VII large subunit [Saprospiraceae bacterium]|nr:exodeoxyribonuclease VII large subunit [Saprospiraceae bacterium]
MFSGNTVNEKKRSIWKHNTLHELNVFLRRVVALNFTESVWVTAEIGQINESRGHYYLSLLEKNEDEIVAQIQAVIWARDFARIRRQLSANTEGVSADTVLTDGMSIKFRGRLEFHEVYGLKIIIEEIDATYTIGKLELQRLKTIAELKKAGLIGKNSQLFLPRVVQRIAVISSETAAGWQDFLNHIVKNDYGYRFDIQLFQSAMQGSLVERTMLQQLETIKAEKQNFDAIVIIRGGGARLDLAAFDTPSVCEAVARSPLPVLVGIGHDVDQTILDLVAHTSLKTPTAVADFILAHNARFETMILEVNQFVKQYAAEKLREGALQLRQMEDFLKFKTTSSLAQEKLNLKNYLAILPISAHRKIKAESRELDNVDLIIDFLGIESTLKRGFSITRFKGRALTDSAEIQSGDLLETQLLTGVIESRVIKE